VEPIVESKNEVVEKSEPDSWTPLLLNDDRIARLVRLMSNDLNKKFMKLVSKHTFADPVEYFAELTFVYAFMAAINVVAFENAVAKKEDMKKVFLNAFDALFAEFEKGFADGTK
jgi:hypothetical protein